MSAYVACELLNNPDLDAPVFLNNSSPYKNVCVENPSIKQITCIQKMMAKAEHDDYINKCNSTKNRLQKKLAAKQAHN